MFCTQWTFSSTKKAAVAEPEFVYVDQFYLFLIQSSNFGLAQVAESSKFAQMFINFSSGLYPVTSLTRYRLVLESTSCRNKQEQSGKYLKTLGSFVFFNKFIDTHTSE